MKRIMLLAYFFFLMNWAAVMALYCFVRGREDVWRPSSRDLESERLHYSGATTPDRRSDR
jgi:hypothetical protein